MDGIDTNVSATSLATLRPASTPSTTTAAAPVSSTPAVQQTSVGAANANLISLLADAAPPIDSKKIDAIRSLIASGRYPIDEHAIAAKMIALDTPGLQN